MKVWIDAAPAGAELAVLGMSPVERHVRGALRSGIAASDIIVDGGARTLPGVAALLGPSTGNGAVRITASEGDLSQRLQRALDEHGGPLIALAGDTVADPRLLGQLAGEAGVVVASDDSSVDRALSRGFSAVYGDWAAQGDGHHFVLRLEAGTRLPAAASVAALGEALLTNASTRRFNASGRDKHLAMQRRDVPFWIRHLSGARARDDVERFLFDASYKGSTDVITRHVLPYLVWPLVLVCARLRIHPNTITVISVIATFAAVPFFAIGWWGTGLVLAWIMAVLDSVDGKVARLTMTDSRAGELLDHGVDIVHPPLWYFAWALGLSGLAPIASLLDGSILEIPVFRAAILMLALYVADRLVLAIYKARFRRGLHSHAPIDGLVRSIISRRNINLALFTIALALGWGVTAFYAVVAWQLATLLWHAARTAWILCRNEAPPLPT